MCHFISWIRHADGIFFLTDDEMKTKKGKDLIEYLGPDNYWEDVKGHGAITEYFNFRSFEGIHEELSLFNSPKYLPKIIFEAIKKGKFHLIGRPDTVDNFLVVGAIREYEWLREEIINEREYKIKMSHAKLEDAKHEANSEYDKVVSIALGKYEAFKAEYQLAEISGKVDPDLLSSMKHRLNDCYKEYIQVMDEGHLKREDKINVVYDEYITLDNKLHNKATQTLCNLFWDIFAKPENRLPVWR